MGQNPLHPFRILLVEDHDDTAKVTARLLGRCGYVVTVAKSCAAGLETAKTGFDLLIADIRLPDRSSIELLDELRQQGEVKSIATTADGMPEDTKRCVAAGLDVLLVKPYHFHTLEEAIEQLTEKSSSDMQDTSASQSA